MRFSVSTDHLKPGFGCPAACTRRTIMSPSFRVVRRRLDRNAGLVGTSLVISSTAVTPHTDTCHDLLYCKFTHFPMAVVWIFRTCLFAIWQPMRIFYFHCTLYSTSLYCIRNQMHNSPKLRPCESHISVHVIIAEENTIAQAQCLVWTITFGW